jgi:hypothetical protein
MSRLLEKVIAFIIVLVVFIITSVILVSTMAFKPKWEINKRDVKSIEDVNYSENVSEEYSLNVGSVNVKLGQSINPDDYNLIKDYEYKGIIAKHLLSQSKRYEILAVKNEDNWYIYSLRTTNPGVSNPQGFEISSNRNNIHSNIDINSGRTIRLKDGNKTINLYFVADILCEMYISYI